MEVILNKAMIFDNPDTTNTIFIDIPDEIKDQSIRYFMEQLNDLAVIESKYNQLQGFRQQTLYIIEKLLYILGIGDFHNIDSLDLRYLQDMIENKVFKIVIESRGD